MVIKRKTDLIRTEMPQVNYRPHSPILIDSNNRILAGNGLFDALPDEVECIVFNHVIQQAIIELEAAVLASGFDDIIERYEAIDAFCYEQVHYVAPEPESFLFDAREVQCITKENYIYPGEVSFKKHNMCKVKKDENKEEFLHESFFSSNGR